MSKSSSALLSAITTKKGCQSGSLCGLQAKLLSPSPRGQSDNNPVEYSFYPKLDRLRVSSKNEFT